VERGVQIISEASRHLSADLKSRHPEIPWVKVAAIGSVLRHDYERISPDVIWKLATADLGPATKQLNQICHGLRNKAEGDSRRGIGVRSVCG
jgi:uncharacterized protein with HEPN domain